MQKIQKRITTILFFLVITILPVLTLLSKKEEFSELENRKLQKRPSFSIENWFDEKFMDDFSQYVSDHFIGRIGWIRKKVDIELMTGKTEINGVYITSERLMENIPEPDMQVVEKSINAINEFSQSVSSPVFVLIAPTSAGIYPETLPENTPQISQHDIINTIYKKLNTNIYAIDVYDILNASKEDYIYYRTDHHWTSLGAYYAYYAAIQKLGFKSIAYSKYDVEHASNDFLGTYYSKTLYEGLHPDTIDIYSYRDGNSVVSCTVNNGVSETVYDSIYFKEFLDKKDKYCTYLGTNQSMINIKTNIASDKKILIFKDSYANSFVPFLTQHYNEITVLDMRYVNNFRDFVNPDDYSQILFLYNSTTFASDENLKKIAY